MSAPPPYETQVSPYNFLGVLAAQPAANTVKEGDLYFDPATNILYVCVADSPGVQSWHPVVSGAGGSGASIFAWHGLLGAQDVDPPNDASAYLGNAGSGDPLNPVPGSPPETPDLPHQYPVAATAARVARNFSVRTLRNTIGGSSTVSLLVNGSVVLTTPVLPGGTANVTQLLTGPVIIPQGSLIDVRVDATGVTGTELLEISATLEIL